MKPMPTSPRPQSIGSLKAVCYESTAAAKPPIPFTSGSSPPPLPHLKQTGLGRPITSASQQLSPYSACLKLTDGTRRDSAPAPSATNTPLENRTALGTDKESAASLNDSPNPPKFPLADDAATASSKRNTRWGSMRQRVSKDQIKSSTPPMPFMGIVTDIPTGTFDDLTIPGQVDFSKRGSMLIGGKKANNANGSPFKHSLLVGSRRIPDASLPLPSPSVPARILSADDEMLSHKVRSMYEGGTDRVSDWAGRTHVKDKSGLDNGVVTEEAPRSPVQSNGVLFGDLNVAPGSRNPSFAATVDSKTESLIMLQENELASGIEDWEDIRGGDVDRYGFIVQRRLPSQGSSLNSPLPDPPRIQRVSTSLQVASEAPRRERSTVRRNASTRTPRSATAHLTTRRTSSRLVRPSSSQSSSQGSISGGQSKLRSTTSRLPHHKDRRIIDEAGDMLTLPPGLADIAENDESSQAAEELKRKEWEREGKWRKMAKIVNKNRDGGGMTFEFDTKSPKVIERTWKGIPDRWRATAWHAFMTASAKNRKGSPSDEQLITTFQKLIDQGSPDDVQIDIDVPRTINSHIMFRRRYRGGQRLLFRVLHCLSIYFPDTGYVQGMAALAATLLCYFDEEMAFVMLVRLWQLRGLEQLYEAGFQGLMLALDEFEKTWLGNGELATKLTKLNISPTAYGTRWYLTLFNYSIPFPAQLRVWDVFMLLGDPDPIPPLPPPSNSSSTADALPPTALPKSFNGGLDVLHAASAALVDGTRDILLDSDFENSMKVLTSWIPVRDEELLMRVAKAEWKLHRKRT